VRGKLGLGDGTEPTAVAVAARVAGLLDAAG
jgi:hypothetical protein